MNDSFTHDQTTVLITSLIDMLAIKNEEIELGEAYAASLYKVIDGLDAEITSLKAKMRAKTPKANKAPKVIKKVGRPAVKKIAPKDMDAETAKIAKATGGKAYTAESPVKRKPGRPKKVVG